MKKILLSTLLIASLIAAEEAGIKPTLETKVQGVKQISSQEVRVDMKEIKSCVKGEKLAQYSKSSLNIPVETKKSGTILVEYIDVGKEDGVSVCKDKYNYLHIRIWENKLFNKGEK